MNFLPKIKYELNLTGSARGNRTQRSYDWNGNSSKTQSSEVCLQSDTNSGRVVTARTKSKRKQKTVEYSLPNLNQSTEKLLLKIDKVNQAEQLI